MAEPFRYRSGEEIQVGDRIFYARLRALIEHVLSPDDDQRNNWQLSEGGVVFLTELGDRLSLQLDEHDLEDIRFKMRSVDDPQKHWQKDWPRPRGGGRVTDDWKTL